MSLYELLQIVLSFILEFIVIRATCEVLEMRSNLAYVLLHVGCFVVGYFMRTLNAFAGIALSMMTALTFMVLPVAMSQGSLRKRILRMSLINVGSVTTEVLGTLFYSFIGGDITRRLERFIDESALQVTIVYCLLIPTCMVLFEVIIAICKSSDRDYDASVELPIILLAVIAFCFYPLLVQRSLSAGRDSDAIVLTFFVVMLASLLITLALLYIAQWDGEVQRRLAGHAAMARQERHVRSEVEASIRRTVGMSRLRHDLANQVEVVERLASKGSFSAADRYLELLQLQAQSLIGEDHE